MYKKLRRGLWSFSDSTFSGNSVSDFEEETGFFKTVAECTLSPDPVAFIETQTIENNNTKITRRLVKDLLYCPRIIYSYKCKNFYNFESTIGEYLLTNQ